MIRKVTGLMLLALVAPAWAMESTPAATSAPVKAATAATAARAEAAAKETSALQPAVQTSPPASAPPASAPPAAAPAGNAPAAQDRIELDTTQITGNRELPRVLYVVPWKRPDLGDLAGRPANSLLDEVLAPVDRDVFRRQNRYYQALKPDSAGKGKADGTEGEK